MESEESVVLKIILEKKVNVSLLKSIKHCNDYNRLVSEDPGRHLTLDEFKKIKTYATNYYNAKNNYN